MLDIKYIREHAEEVKKNCENRGVKVDIDRLLELDQNRRIKITEVEELRASRNQGSKGKPTEEEIVKMREVGDKITSAEAELLVTETEYKNLLLTVPNLTHPAVPIGKEEDFKVLNIVGEPPKFDFEAKDHEEILVNLDLIDFERATKVSGSKFFYTKNELVELNHALVHYGSDIVKKHGFKLIETPDLAKDKILEGIGFNPRGPEAQIYSIEGQDLSLIGTAEITIGGYHSDEILDFSNGPIKYAGISHCFRTEAGAYGKTSKGLYRVHQFTKLELFIFCKPEDSNEMHDHIRAVEEEIIQGLEIPYRVIDVASGDLGGPAYRKYDMEAWMVMKNDYGEVTSASNCTDFQSRRLNIRYKNENGQNDYAHTLNGTALNNSRWPLILAENFQQEDGSIKIPKALHQYTGFKEIKSKK